VCEGRASAVNTRIRVVSASRPFRTGFRGGRVAARGTERRFDIGSHVARRPEIVVLQIVDEASECLDSLTRDQAEERVQLQRAREHARTDRHSF
jgi:hypothetical protein